MGCCISSTKSDPDHTNGFKLPAPEPDPIHIRDHRGPPPPPVEEESVKEVLSETPIVPKPQNPIVAVAEVKNVQMPMLQLQPEKSQTKGLLHIHKAEKEVSEASQISETVSLSTTTTTTIREEQEDDNEAMSKRRREVGVGPRKRPYTGDLSSRRERVAKSPAREKRVQGRGLNEVRTRKLNVGSTGVREVSGEGSRRRERSPATGKVAGGVGRRLSEVKGTGRAGSQSQSLSQQSGEVKEELNDGVVVEQGSRESLENPHVSLECFIFL